MSRLAILSALWLGLCLLHPANAVHAVIGTPVAQAEMPSVEGAKIKILREAEINVLVFFRPNQERSLGALKELAQCQKNFAGKSVQWTAIASASASADSAAAPIRAAGFAAPVLLDNDDALYGSLGLALHPVVVIVNRERKLAAFEPFRAVNYCEVVSAHLRHLLREIGDEELRQILDPPKATQGGEDQVAKSYRAFAEVLLKSGNLEKALDNVRKSIDKDPKVASAQALLGQILAAQGNCAEAIQAFDRALVLDAASAAATEGLERCKTPR